MVNQDYNEQVALLELPQFSLKLCDAMRAQAAPASIGATLVMALSGECAQCGAPASGEELLALCKPAAKDEPARLARLRQGYCARKDCPSHFYRVKGSAHPEVDWVALLDLGEQVMEEQASMETEAENGERRRARKLLLIRVAAGVGVVLILLLLRQWQTGGTIPLLRQPEKFHVDQFENIVARE